MKTLHFIANQMHDLISRVNLRSVGLGAGKRPRAWEEFDYPEEIDFDQCYRMWQRNGIAHGGVEKLIDNCWKADPWLLEGDEYDNKEETTPWEEQMRINARNWRLWKAFADADRRYLIGGCSALLLETDRGAWREPIRGGRLVSVIPAWKSQLRPAQREPITNRIRSWEWIGENGQTSIVHPDRVFIIGDYDHGLSMFAPVYNDLLNLIKIMGGSGESYLKNASRQLSVEFGEGASLSQLAQDMGKKPDEAHEVLNDMARDMNSGIDAIMALSGGKVTPLVTTVPDPQQHVNVNLQSVCAGWRIPVKVLVGNQTGERASSEDVKDFNARCQSRLVKELLPLVTDFFRHLIRVRLILPPTGEFITYADDLTEATNAEKLANAKVMAEINNQSAAAGTIFEADEIREAAGYEAADGTLPPPPADDDDEEPV